jgi:NADH-quinone oxidoreductase subunit N
MGMLLAFGVLIAAALGLLAWETNGPQAARRVAPYATLTALVAAFVLSTTETSALASSQPALRQLLPDELGRLMRALLLLGLALRVLVEPPIAPLPGRGDAPDTWPPSGHYVLRLPAAVGGLLAVSAGNLAVLALGLALFAVAASFTAPTAHIRLERARLLGLGAALFGALLLYASAATLDLAALSRFFWEHPGPQSAMLLLGVGLTVVGLALLARLLVWDDPANDGMGAASAVLGVAVLLRVCVYALGALYHVWGWLLAGLGLLTMLVGWLRSRRLRGVARLRALDGAQRGFLLLTLAYAATPNGLQVSLMALVAYWLGEFILGAVTRRLAMPAQPEAEFTGLLPRNIWLGAPALLGLLSLTGVPLTLGFDGRAGLLWAAPSAPWLAVAITALVLSVLCALGYLQVIVAMLRASVDAAPLPSPALVCAVLLVAALALVALGLYPQAFGGWVSRLGA